MLALGVVVSAAVRFGHEHMFNAYGAPLTIAAAGGGLLIGAIVLVREAMRQYRCGRARPYRSGFAAPSGLLLRLAVRSAIAIARPIKRRV